MTGLRARLLCLPLLVVWLGNASAATAAPAATSSPAPAPGPATTAPPATTTPAPPTVPEPAPGPLLTPPPDGPADAPTTDTPTTDASADAPPPDAPPPDAPIADPPDPAPLPEPVLPPLRTEPSLETPPTIGPGATAAPEPAARHRLVYSNALVLRLNPLGLEDRFSLMYRRRLSARTGKLWDDTYFGVGITPTFSPSITRIGPTIQLIPIALLHLRASYYLIGYYGSQGFKAHPFDSPNDQYGPDTIKGRADAKQAINTYGGQAELSVLFQVKFGPIALRDELIFFHNNIKLPGQNNVFYDLRHDILAPGKGWFLSNDTDLLYTNAKIRLNVGVRGTYYHIFYPGAVYEPGDVTGTNQNDSARFGPLISYALKDRPEKRFTKPTIFVAAQWWLKHRYRTGQEVHQGIPLVILGFSFTGELWSKK